MSAIREFKDPCDMYDKLIREGKRCWFSRDPKGVADHFFNFCITSLSLRDWCIKFKGYDGPKRDEFYKAHSSDKWLDYCGSIANMSKHFSLCENRTSSVQSVVPTKTRIVGLNIDGSLYSGVDHEKDSLIVITSDNDQKDLMDILYWTCESWCEMFDTFKVGDIDRNKIALMFLNYIRS